MIRQFDLFRNPSDVSRATAPYVIVLQSHHLTALRTVIVAPLIHASLVRSDALVMLPVQVGPEPFTLNLAVMGAAPAAQLRSFVANLVEHEDTIRRGLDRLFTGF